MKLFFKILLLGAVITINSANAQDSTPQVQISNGTIEGVLNAKTGIKVLKAFPLPSHLLATCAGKNLSLLQTGRACVKQTILAHNPMEKRYLATWVSRSDSMSEDCLYLNVWTPAKSATEKLPFWYIFMVVVL